MSTESSAAAPYGPASPPSDKELVLKVIPLPADTNGNGSVDSSDLIIVFDNLQGQLPPSTEFLI